MKVWIERVKVTGADGWPTDRYDVVTSEGHSVAPLETGLFRSGIEARDWASTRHQIMDIPRPKQR